jgi:amino acid adenylation domain-containing protein
MANIDRLFNLPPEKRELLQRLLGQHTTVARRIERRPGGMSVAPASFGQRRIWFLDRLEPGSPVYQISTALELRSVLNAEVLARSVNALVERHEALRTTFAETDGELFQVIAERLEITVPVVDLTGLPEAGRTAEAARIGSADAVEPFDLAAGPLLRVTLIRLEPTRSLLLLTVHHIVSDGWSINVLLNELPKFYDAIAAGRAPELPDLPIQYADYTLWQREQFTGDLTAKEMAYWRRQLEGAPRLRLPADWPGSRRTHKGAREFFRLGALRTRHLEEIARQAKATLFMTLLAAFQVLLGRYTGLDDIVTGSPVAGRNRPETEGLIGFLLNTVCLRTSLQGDPDFLTLLGRVRETALGAYAHQELPFEKLVEELAPERRLTGSPLFDVMFVLQAGHRWPGAGESDQSAQTQPEYQFESGAAKFDLTLSMLETPDGMVGSLEYSTDLFHASSARRMVGHFVNLIDSIASEPHTPVSKLRILTPDEERRIVHEWNATGAPFRDDVRVEQLVAEQAVRTPDAVAIIHGQDEITYEVLWHDAIRLANYLRRCGVGSGSRVGIFMGRSRRILPALLGTWAAGCVYVPLDYESPAERTRYMLEDADLAAVLTEDRLADCLPPGKRRVVCLDAEAPAISREPVIAPRVLAVPSDPAYILYTSGSTGKPKGVVVSHLSVVNYLTWVNSVLFASPPHLLPTTTKITFDASLKQLFAPLLRGEPVWLIPEEVVADVGELARAIGQRGDFALNCVPGLWSALLDTLTAGKFESSRRLKRLLIGGEEVSAELLERTFAHFPDLEVWNLYGPTEATANATAQVLHPGEAISIGRPVANTVARVLDRCSQLAPVGVVGELHIGGVGIASGYWNRPELTAERFVPDTFAEQPGRRLYRTGDLVRYSEDGSLVFAGRIDRQVKLRGYRIEPGEIEAELARHPAVEQAAVVLAGVDSKARLVAYVESRKGESTNALALRRFAAGGLPDHMVPSHFVFLDRLPRGMHGKIDRAALPPILEEGDEQRAAFIAPRNEHEHEIAAIWEAVLGASRVGVQTSFFELGGHSLLATQVVSRIRQAFGVEVPLRVLFETPTVEALASLVERAKDFSPVSGSGAIQRLKRADRRVSLSPTIRE